MLTDILLGIGKGIGTIFINPLFYWIIFLMIAVSYKRAKQERKQFGRRISPALEEIRFTLLISIISSIVISLFTLSFGLMITYETSLLLIVTIIVLSVTATTTFLSAAYTLGITFILATVLPFLDLPIIMEPFDFGAIQMEHFISLAFLTGIFLFVEGLLISSDKAASYPEMIVSERGIWVGQHYIRRLAFIPCLLLIPVSNAAIQLPLFPYFDLGENSYMLILFPFVIGFNFRVRSQLPKDAAKRLGQATLLLSLLVWICAVASLYYPILTMVAIVLAIGGREWLTYRHKRLDAKRPSLFHPLDKGIKVLATIPNSPADRLGIKVGEVILKVNGQNVVNQAEFYEALQNSGAFFKLSILDIHKEIRFINSPFYEQDHYALGLIFTEKPNHI
jgi:hypothetical protein